MCPSVVSLNKITRAESVIIVTQASDLPLRKVVFGVTSRLLVIHFIVFSRRQQTLPLTSDQCFLTVPPALNGTIFSQKSLRSHSV